MMVFKLIENEIVPSVKAKVLTVSITISHITLNLLELLII